MERHKPSVLYAFVFSLVTVASAAQSGAIHQQIEQTYSFQPHLLSSQQINEKSAFLDQFWAKAKAEPSLYVSALRQELGDFKKPPFFLYDGSMLLLSLSNTQADRKIALAAMARCDLRDVQPDEYFRQVHHMATLNEDTTAAALHILDDPNFKVFIPQTRAHAGAKLCPHLPAAACRPGLLVTARRRPLEGGE